MQPDGRAEVEPPRKPQHQDNDGPHHSGSASILPTVTGSAKNHEEDNGPSLARLDTFVVREEPVLKAPEDGVGAVSYPDTAVAAADEGLDGVD